ncbi:DUF438 domain-containing protein [Haliovirga abyssi]|uniref:Hemerythrin-like domain-containing protein n=1 Tax=Haliovirga abyssi TaxID=2996794 RepID=A0AAU9DW84_9FUSO|nr:PAS domain-containing protein [Haliovirga abyssi]BDU49460.1 hypothetical protein HLVA_00290 [Haliovirga abyssi]
MEIIKNHEEKINKLLEFSKGMISGEDGKFLVDKYQKVIDEITPFDVIELEDRQIKMGITPAIIKNSIEKIMNIFYTPLENYNWEKPEEGNPLYYYMKENDKLKEILEEIKKEAIMKQDITKLKEYMVKIKEINNHYIRKENVLFPYLEKLWTNYTPLKVMWSLHDDIRKMLKNIDKLIEQNSSFNVEINKTVGEFFFLIYGMIFKEELVVFPVAMQTVPEKSWQEMMKEELGFEFSFIEKPIIKFDDEVKKDNMGNLKELFFKVETGELNKNQLELILNSLPIDITFIDENDEVKYFSKPKDRFFPRTPAIIGRKVQNCHPPESVNIVERILDSFKSGEKDSEKFWLKMRNKYIYIQYFAVRDDKNRYIGTLEVGQDITEISKLEGEKRLVDDTK